MPDRVQHGDWIFFKQSRYWTVEWWRSGKRFRRTTGTPDWDAAIRRAEKLTRTVDSSGNACLTLGKAIERFFEDVEDELEPSTIRRYKQVLNDMAAWIGEDTPLVEVSRRDLKGYLKDVKTRVTQEGNPLSKATIRNVRSNMRPFWSWALDEDLIEADIAYKLARPRKGDKVEARPAPPVAVVRKGLRRAKRRDELIYEWMMVGLGTGLRPGEQASAMGARLIPKKRMLQVDGKTGQRTIKLAEGPYRILAARKLRYGDGPLFPSLTGTIIDLRNLCKRLKDVTGTKLNLYALRHRFASDAAKSMDLYSLAAYMGHGRNVATTAKWYAELQAEQIGAPPTRFRTRAAKSDWRSGEV